MAVATMYFDKFETFVVFFFSAFLKVNSYGAKT